MAQQEAIEREQGAVEIQTANLRELARLVLEFDEAFSDSAPNMTVAFVNMINFAKGVAQCQPS